eukprot:1306848-Rhodomonas_salina.1
MRTQNCSREICDGEDATPSKTGMEDDGPDFRGTRVRLHVWELTLYCHQYPGGTLLGIPHQRKIRVVAEEIELFFSMTVSKKMRTISCQSSLDVTVHEWREQMDFWIRLITRVGVQKGLEVTTA